MNYENDNTVVKTITLDGSSEGWEVFKLDITKKYLREVLKELCGDLWFASLDMEDTIIKDKPSNIDLNDWLVDILLHGETIKLIEKVEVTGEYKDYDSDVEFEPCIMELDLDNLIRGIHDASYYLNEITPYYFENLYWEINDWILQYALFEYVKYIH